MPKLKLEIEELSVETFDTAATSAQRGTAFGHGGIVDTDNPYGCGGSSGESCAGGGDQEVLAGSCGGSGWTGMDTCEGGSCLETCTFNTCLSCTATRLE